MSPAVASVPGNHDHCARRDLTVGQGEVRHLPPAGSQPTQLRLRCRELVASPLALHRHEATTGGEERHGPAHQSVQRCYSTCHDDVDGRGRQLLGPRTGDTESINPESIQRVLEKRDPPQQRLYQPNVDVGAREGEGDAGKPCT